MGLNIDFKKILQGAGISIVILQIASLVVSAIINIPVLQLGNAILLILLASGLTLFVETGFKLNQMNRWDFVRLFVYVGVLVALYIYLPDLYPDIFGIFKNGVFSAISPS